MKTVWIMGDQGDAAEALRQAFCDAGLDAYLPEDDATGSGAGVKPDAVVVIAEPTNLGDTLSLALRFKEHAGAAVLLITDLDRSGWDRTFASPEAMSVDALFDLPPNPDAVLRRLLGILESRDAARGEPAQDMAQIVARAVANEEAAEAFYRKAAASVSDATTRDALSSLADDEKEHKRVLKAFEAGKCSLPEGETKTARLVESLGAPDFTADLSPADAFLLAARKEQLAVEFYENWAALYPAGRERDLLRRLAEVERRHKARVEAMFSNAAFPENF